MATNTANPATPTAEDKAAFEAVRKDLAQALTRKRHADKKLAEVEVQLYQLEASYLTETTTNSGGNIITGFENYLKNQGIGRRKFEVTDSDRMFSASSTTYQRSLEIMGEGEESTATQDDYKATTVVVPPIKQRDEVAANMKRVRDREYQRAKRAERKKRSAIASDDESVTSAAGRKPAKRARTSVMNDDD
ncbi:histone acetyltransferase subunit NuA4-domain-containing protein [Thelephora terrestris]|uniref:Chromatin modification-related protein EAF6 n=1 Tax=Thelephora terrestris TaxID=56493 RepID=A0A9P6H421_9AGAM|nr:histone acetyltransferase subunit NuA4-domain-containing protein [Thelephora terrestris]